VDSTKLAAADVSAVVCATSACEIAGWRCASFLDTLAAAHAQAGQFESAIQRAEEVMELASPELKADVLARLEQYRDRRPYRRALPARLNL
jgi:Flp pilus assembly protein TadD